MAVKFEQRAAARDRLLELLKPGNVVYTVCFHVSQSGMSRDIGTFIVKNNEIMDITYQVANVIGWPVSKNQGVRVAGCGMDMGFHLVYSLGAMLWPDGTKDPHGSRNGEPDRTGGYALKQRWL